MKIILASRNLHKLSEMEKLFSLPHIRLVSSLDIPHAPDPDENGITFAQNAVIKAKALAEFTHEWTLADDSGLCVDALRKPDGTEVPGVYSARYCGEHGNDAANNEKLLADLESLEEKSHNVSRRCHFACALALVSPDGQTHLAEGICPGILLRAGRGNNGFGYDPLFQPDGYDQTFAELPGDVKCTFSHRAVAARKMREILLGLFPGHTSH